GQLDRAAGHLDRVAVDCAAEVLLGIGRRQVDAAVGDVAVALRACAARVGVDELAVVGDPDRPAFVDVVVAGGRVGHVEVGVFLADHVGAVAGDVARLVGLAVAAGKVHDHALVADHLDAVRRDFGLHHLAAADVDFQAHVLLAVGTVAEGQPVELGVDVDLGAGRVVLAGAPVHAGPADLVGQPRPAALDGRFGGDLQRPLDGGLVRDRRVELDDDRRRDADGLAVGELESTVDHLGGRDRGDLALHRNRLAVVTDRRPVPGVGPVIAQRLGDRVHRPVAVEGAGTALPSALVSETCWNQPSRTSTLIGAVG